MTLREQIATAMAALRKDAEGRGAIMDVYGDLADAALAATEAAGFDLVKRCPKGWGAACSRNGGPYCCTACIGDRCEKERALAARPKP